MYCVLDKMLDLVRGPTVSALPLIVGNFNDGVFRLQDWFSSRLGCVCAWLRLAKMGCCLGVSRWVIYLPRQLQAGSQDQKLRRSPEEGAQRQTRREGGRGHSRRGIVFSDGAGKIDVKGRRQVAA